MILAGTDENTLETVRRPGRYEGSHPMTPLLDRIVLDGCADDEASGEQGGYVAVIGPWLLVKDSVGFVGAEKYATVAHARDAYHIVAAAFGGDDDA